MAPGLGIHHWRQGTEGTWSAPGRPQSRASVRPVAAGVAFITWFYRVRANAGLFSPNGHRHSQGWAIGGWITPVLLFWVPRRMVSDSWLASTPPGPDGERQYGSHRLLDLWWLTWIASVATTRISNSWSTDDNTQEIRTALGIAVASDLLELTAAGPAIALVVRLTAMQDTRAVSLEQALMELTADSVEYPAGEPK